MPRAFVHPLWWAALALLLLNDHVLKGAAVLPGAVTGKLSDVAGLIVLPPLLTLLFGGRARASRWAALAISGAALASVNLWPAAARAVEQLMGALGISAHIWVDATDLWTLPALWLAAPLCAPLARAHRSRARRVVQQLGVGIAAFACIATTGSDNKDKDDKGDGPTLINQSDGTLTVLIASTDAAGGCRLYRDDRVAALSRDAFANRREVTLKKDARTPLAQAGPTECGAAWVLLPDGDEIFLFWRDLDPIAGYVPDDDGSRRARQLVVEGRDGRYTTDQGDDLFRFELGDEPPETSCPDEDVDYDLDWTLPAASQGFFELDEIRETDDGCIEVDWISQSDDSAPTDTQRLCLPDWAFPFERRETLSLVLESGVHGGHRLQISRLDEGAVKLQLVLWLDAGTDLLEGGAIQDMDADDCFGRVTPCGAYVRPAELDLRGDDDPLRAGDETEFDRGAPTHTRMLVGPARFVDWTGAACEGPEARVGGSASWLELREF